MKPCNLKRDRQIGICINARLRRARRLYVFFMRYRLNIYRDDVLDYMADRMRERGLYSCKTDDRSVRQSILGHLCKVEVKRYRRGSFDWHNWLDANGWDAWRGYSKPTKQLRND